jgi:hypothetical protein
MTNYAHIVLFAVFFVMTTRQLRMNTRAAWFCAGIATVVMGALVEGAQAVTGSGHCRVRDLVPDAAGALLGAGLVFLWANARSRRRHAAVQMGASLWILIAALSTAVSAYAQERPDFSGTWLLDEAQSGNERVVWTQTRPRRFVLSQTPQELTLDTADGSLFGVRRLVIGGPLRYKFDGSRVVVVDHSVGDLPEFVRMIRTEATWDHARLITRATHFAETSSGLNSGVTRVVVFSMMPNGQLRVDRTGYRGEPGPELFVTTLPTILHRGHLEDDLVYAHTRLSTQRPHDKACHVEWRLQSG